MGSDCILCESSVRNHASLPQIIEAFKIFLKALETRANNIEKEKTGELHDLKLRLKNELERSHNLEEERKKAEQRSDLYKKRFLDAQNAIEKLHEKNIQLSSQRNVARESVSQETIRNFPFAIQKAKDDLSPGAIRLILAPDTCFTNVESYDDSICNSSDEEDFKPDPKRNSKSPRRSPLVKKKETPPKPAISVTDSFFAKPKSTFHSVKKRNKPEIHSDTDLDETRLDTEFPMDTSIDVDTNKAAKVVEVLSDADVWELCGEMDSIPPSPVLSASKGKRFGSFNGSSFSGNSSRKENSSPSLLDGKILFGRPPTLTNSTLFKSKETMKEETDSDNWDKGNIMSDSLPLHRLRQTTPMKQSRHGNTSLDELFDKTYGDLETTTMMDDTTINTLNNDEDEDEMAELLQDVQDADGSYSKANNRIVDPKQRRNKASTSRVNISSDDDSFDVLPNKVKEKNFKYQEVVRKRDAREKLDAKACAQCEAYYCDLSDDERREMMRKVCRHKHVDAPPSTPEHFWEIGIPNTAECRKRGYINDETKLPTTERQSVQRLRRKKPLESYFTTKRK